MGIITAAEARKRTLPRDKVLNRMVDEQLEFLESKIIEETDNGSFSYTTRLSAYDQELVSRIDSELIKAGYEITLDEDHDIVILTIDWKSISI